MVCCFNGLFAFMGNLLVGFSFTTSSYFIMQQIGYNENIGDLKP